MAPKIIFRNDGAVLIRNAHLASFIMNHVHDAETCTGPCVLHNPSQHSMSDFDLVLRASGLMERICPHGVGHPDPDSLAYFMRLDPDCELGTHGCEGCCASDDEWRAIWDDVPDDSTGPIKVGTNREDNN